MFTREIDYAIRALLYLAQHNGEVVSTTVLAEAMEIPYRFLRRILLHLGERGLVISVRGKQGGLRLAKAPDTISLLDIARAVDADAVKLNICLSDPQTCRRSPLCTVFEALRPVQVELEMRLANITLQSLVRPC